MRDPRQDPRQGDILKDKHGVARTVMGRPTEMVRYSVSSWPYLITVELGDWQSWAENNTIQAREGVPCDS